MTRTITKNLNFYMTRTLDVLLKENTTLTEVGTGKALDTVKCIAKCCFVPAQLHTDTAATGGTFEHDGITNTKGFTLGVWQVIQQTGSR